MASSLFPNQSILQQNHRPSTLPGQMVQPQPNTIGQQPIQNNQSQEQILQMWRMVKNSNNPEQIFNQMLSSNPEFNIIMSTLNSIGDPKAAFYALAQKKGADPNAIINLLKQA